MVNINYEESNYKFTDPIRFFKANDPYYFEVDNIPLKQLQENCLWLKDQLGRVKEVNTVKREGIEELRPYALGSDRKIRVKPGRFTARINDASTRIPLAYLRKLVNEFSGESVWNAAKPIPGQFSTELDEAGLSSGSNQKLINALDTFKTILAQNALGMNGLAERAFTWAIVDTRTPLNNYGAETTTTQEGGLAYATTNATLSPFVVTQALLWAKSSNLASDRYILPTFNYSDGDEGFNTLPRTESFLIKAWRGISRLAIVDVDEEITVEVPRFDSTDFNYINENGISTSVPGVTHRIDLVFIYSKPVDMSSVNILNANQKKTITKPVLGIVRGAGIKTKFTPLPGTDSIHLVAANESILASPGDLINTNMGFTSTSSNDLSKNVRGSFPAPDDLLNLAPLICEKLEDSAYELVGQSILPVAYVFVDGASNNVDSTDVIDIRPFFRTAELTYNERAGIAAAFPQLSIANPAVGKSELEFELSKVKTKLNSSLDDIRNSTGDFRSSNVLAAGYVFGGWYFGVEGALYDFQRKQLGISDVSSSPTSQFIKNEITSKYSYGNNSNPVTIPDYPDWDLSKWVRLANYADRGNYCNDYLNVFLSCNVKHSPSIFNQAPSAKDPSIVAGSQYSVNVADGRANNFRSSAALSTQKSRVNFQYVSKKIMFNRPPWLLDYKVDVTLLNCLTQSYRGDQTAAVYDGIWVEKGTDYFTIYVAWAGSDNNPDGSLDPNEFINIFSNSARVPAPHKLPGANSAGITISERGGDRFSSVIVPVDSILYSNINPITTFNTKIGHYEGNPRVGLCTYPTIMWTFTGITSSDAQFFYSDLNTTSPRITLKGGN